MECVGCADRSCFDLERHRAATKVDLTAKEDLPEPVSNNNSHYGYTNTIDKMSQSFYSHYEYINTIDKMSQSFYSHYGYINTIDKMSQSFYSHYGYTNTIDKLS